MANTTKQQQSNTFTGGLNTDLHPLTTPNNILTDCVNGTILTQNGNEYMLQNDSGNIELKGFKLPPGYVPIGLKEYNGILYIVSYNPITKRTEIGSYPSPDLLGTKEKDDCEFIVNGLDLNEIIQSEFNSKNTYTVLQCNGVPYKAVKNDVIFLSTPDAINSLSFFRTNFYIKTENTYHPIDIKINNLETVPVQLDRSGELAYKVSMPDIFLTVKRSDVTSKITGESTLNATADLLVTVNSDILQNVSNISNNIYIKAKIGETEKIAEIKSNLQEYYSAFKMDFPITSGTQTVNIELTPIIKYNNNTVVFDLNEEIIDSNITFIENTPVTALYTYKYKINKVGNEIDSLNVTFDVIDNTSMFSSGTTTSLTGTYNLYKGEVGQTIVLHPLYKENQVITTNSLVGTNTITIKNDMTLQEKLVEDEIYIFELTLKQTTSETVQDKVYRVYDKETGGTVREPYLENGIQKTVPLEVTNTQTYNFKKLLITSLTFNDRTEKDYSKIAITD